MAEPTPADGHDLKVSFSREGEVELTEVAENGDRALILALQTILQQDALRAGDALTVERHPRQNLIERGLAHLADAVENSRITVAGAELQVKTAKSYALYFRDAQLAEAVREVFGRPLKLQVTIDDATDVGQALPPANAPGISTSQPNDDDVTRRALANPEVRHFQETFPGSKVHKVRNLKE